MSPLCSARAGLTAITSGSSFTCQPFGISPSSDSSNESGKRSATRPGRPVSRPSALARTGSKSTNQDLKSARAMSSSVSFIRRFSSILSSREPRTWAMARCSVMRDGISIGKAERSVSGIRSTVLP